MSKQDDYGVRKDRQDEESIVVNEAFSDSEVIVDQIDWSETEERSVKRKIDFILLPLLAVAFFALQMDRGNIAQALTDTITQDLGITTNQINIGSQLLSAGIVILEIPSNILLQKVGPQRWLSGQIICWGLVATFQLFITNFGGYLATRMLLGLLEAGFIPGALYTISTWYKKSETSARVSIFFLGNILAAALTALIGSGVLSIAGRDGMAGWRWLFLVEGCITVGVGIIFALFLPPYVGNGSPLISFGRWSYFTPRESHILIKRVILDDPAKAHGKIKISRTDIGDTLMRPRIWVHMLITLIATIPVNALGTYSPSIIKSMGFTKVKANAMYSVGLFAAAVFVVTLGLLADWTQKRGPFVLVAALWSLIAYICLRQQSPHANKWSRFAAITVSNVTNSTVHIINVGWLSVNCTTPQQRSIAMAMIIMAANAAGIAGSQVFRTKDAPLYHVAFTVIVALAAVCVAVVIFQIAWYLLSNRKLARKGDGEVPKVEGAGVVKVWRWVW